MSVKVAVTGSVITGLLAVGGFAAAAAFQPPPTRQVQLVTPAAVVVTPTVAPTVAPAPVVSVAPAPQEVVVPVQPKAAPAPTAPYKIATGPNFAGPPQPPNAAAEHAQDYNGGADAIARGVAITPPPVPSP